VSMGQRFLIGLLLLTAGVITAQCQQNSNRSIVVVTVRDERGVLLQDARVTIQGSNEEFFTDATGAVSISLAPGSYDLIVTFRRYGPGRRHLDLPPSATLRADFSLPYPPCTMACPDPLANLQTTQPVVTALVEQDSPKHSKSRQAKGSL